MNTSLSNALLIGICSASLASAQEGNGDSNAARNAATEAANAATNAGRTLANNAANAADQAANAATNAGRTLANDAANAATEAANAARNNANGAANGPTGAATAGDEWTVTLVQRNLESAAVFQSEVAMEGTGVSFAPVPEGGSEFNLWAYRTVPGVGVEEHLVDTEVVGAYLPEGRFWITTGDPYAGPIPRTRADQGFTLNYEVGGLRSGADAPLAAQKVLLDHNYASAVGPIEDGTVGSEVDFGQVFIDRNGPGEFSFAASILPGTDFTQIAGREIFRLYALPDGQIAELELSQAEVQIWPTAGATFSGVTATDAYTIAPDITVNLVSLYPGSQTWIQYYPGPYQAGTVGTQIPGPSLWALPDSPLTTSKTLTNLDSVLAANGPWTLEVVTRTPFGIETVNHTTLNINRNLTLRGSFQALNE